MIPLVTTSHANQTNYADFLSVPREGKLQSIGIAGGMNTHCFRIKIDGHEIIDADTDDLRFHSSQQFGGGEGNNGLSLEAEFNTLDIEIKDGKSPAAEPRFWAAFGIKESQISMDRDEFLEKWTQEESDGLLEIEEEDGLVHLTYNDGDGDEILRVLRGRDKRAEIKLEDDIVRDESIAGTIHCTDWRGQPTNYSADLLPLQVHHSGHVIELLDPDLSQVETGVWFFEADLSSFVATPLQLTISTQHPDWANYHTSFVVR